VTGHLRLRALGGVIGPVVFVGTWARAGAATTGYSPVDDAISDLAAVGASTRVAMSVAFVVYGLGLVAFGSALRDLGERPAAVAAVVTGVATIGVAATPLDGWAGDGLHGACAGIGYAALVALPLLAARSHAVNGRRGWAFASVLTAVATGGCLVASTFTTHNGLWQRLGLTVGDTWIVVTALVMARSAASGRTDGVASALTHGG
jgi:hypothetical protein